MGKEIKCEVINHTGRSPQSYMSKSSKKDSDSDQAKENLKRFDDVASKLFQVPIDEVRELEKEAEIKRTNQKKRED